MIRSESCVCKGGELNPCPGCQGGDTITLLSGDYVCIDECPWMYDYEQENYIIEAYGHYQNGHLVYPLNQFPEWIMQGITHINRIEVERHKIEANKRKSR